MLPVASVRQHAEEVYVAMNYLITYSYSFLERCKNGKLNALPSIVAAMTVQRLFMSSNRNLAPLGPMIEMQARSVYPGLRE